MEDQKKKKIERFILKNSSDLEQMVLKAWKRGDRTIDEVIEITGLPYKIVRKYLPESPAG